MLIRSISIKVKLFLAILVTVLGILAITNSLQNQIINTENFLNHFIKDEYRKILLVKDLKKMGEDAKVALRGARRDQIENVKKSEKDKAISEDESKKLQADVQTLIDKFSKQIDDLVNSKEKDIMTV